MKNCYLVPSRIDRRYMAGGALAILAVVILVGSVAYWQHQLQGLLAAATALFICGLGIASARLVGLFLSGPVAVNYRMLFGMFIRMAVPLLLCMVLVFEGSPLLQLGFVYYLLVFYQLSLAVDICWSVARLKQSLAS